MQTKEKQKPQTKNHLNRLTKRTKIKIGKIIINKEVNGNYCKMEIRNILLKH